jgi:sortase A
MATWRRVALTPTDSRGPLPPHADRPRSRHALRLIERLLVIVGCVCLGYYGYVSAESVIYQAYETRALDALLTREPPRVGSSPRAHAAPTAPRAAPAAGTTIGRLDIPRLDVSAVIRAGSDARTLRLAVGYVPGTALPGQRGNIGLAAHRDTFFRRLGEIRSGDVVRLVTPDGTFAYRVEGTKVVEPTETWVLDDTVQPALTLITCYPFRYLGSAPQRFIVRARLVGDKGQ